MLYIAQRENIACIETGSVYLGSLQPCRVSSIAFCATDFTIRQHIILAFDLKGISLIHANVLLFFIFFFFFFSLVINSWGERSKNGGESWKRIGALTGDREQWGKPRRRWPFNTVGESARSEKRVSCLQFAVGGRNRPCRSLTCTVSKFILAADATMCC